MTEQEAINVMKKYTEEPISKVVIEAHQMAIEALEKQIAKKPNLWGDGYADGELVYDMYTCPNCEVNDEIENASDYCQNCGQKLDWSEEYAE